MNQNYKPMPYRTGRVSVAPQKLAGELERIRKEAAAKDAASEAYDRGVAAVRSRVTLCNIMLFISRQGRVVDEQALDELIGKLCLSCPSRFFVIDYSCDGNAVECRCDSSVATAVGSRGTALRLQSHRGRSGVAHIAARCQSAGP